MAEQGIDISGHMAQMVDAALVNQADLILCMEQGHAEALSVEFPQAARKVYLLSEMCGAHYDIEDPYRQDVEKYRRMVAEVSLLITEGLPRILQLAEENAQQSG
jgi:protein-tyrosine phosphatase